MPRLDYVPHPQKREVSVREVNPNEKMQSHFAILSTRMTPIERENLTRTIHLRTRALQERMQKEIEDTGIKMNFREAALGESVYLSVDHPNPLEKNSPAKDLTPTHDLYVSTHFSPQNRNRTDQQTMLDIVVRHHELLHNAIQNIVDRHNDGKLPMLKTNEKTRAGIGRLSRAEGLLAQGMGLNEMADALEESKQRQAELVRQLGESDRALGLTKGELLTAQRNHSAEIERLRAEHQKAMQNLIARLEKNMAEVQEGHAEEIERMQGDADKQIRAAEQAAEKEREKHRQTLAAVEKLAGAKAMPIVAPNFMKKLKAISERKV